MSRFEDNLTNEILINTKSRSLFELVRDAIKLARHFVISGREAGFSQESQNVASEVLAQIAYGEDEYDDIIEIVEEEIIIDRKNPSKSSREFVSMSDFDKGGKSHKSERKL